MTAVAPSQVGAAEAFPAAGQHSLRSDARLAATAALTVLALRLVTDLVLYGGAIAFDGGPYPGIANALFLYDGGWFMQLAEHGYPAALVRVDGAVQMSPWAFFPAWPAMLGVAWRLTGSETWAAILASHLATVAAGTAIALAVSRFRPGATAVLVAALWATQPMAWVGSTAYSEALFTAFVAVSLWGLLDGRRATSVAGAVLAGLTRANGILVGLAIAAWALAAERGPARRRWLATGVLGTLGAVAWLGVMAFVLRDPLAYVTVQGAQGWGAGLGLDALRAPQLVALQLLAGSGLEVGAAATSIALVVGLALLLLVVRDRSIPPPVVAVTAAFTLFAVLGSGTSAYSVPRYLVPAFVLLVPIADRLPLRRGPRLAVLVGLALVAGSVGLAYALTMRSGINP